MAFFTFCVLFIAVRLFHSLQTALLSLHSGLHTILSVFFMFSSVYRTLKTQYRISVSPSQISVKMCDVQLTFTLTCRRVLPHVDNFVSCFISHYFPQCLSLCPDLYVPHPCCTCVIFFLLLMWSAQVTVATHNFVSIPFLSVVQFVLCVLNRMFCLFIYFASRIMFWSCFFRTRVIG